MNTGVPDLNESVLSMDDKYKTKTQLRAELAFLRQWLHDTGSPEGMPGHERKETRTGVLTYPDRSQVHLSALISASRAVFKKSSFSIVARSVFDLAKPVIGADNGYIALVTRDGKKLELVSTDFGIQPERRPGKPLSLTGLRQQVIETRKTFFINDFTTTSWQDEIPEGHISIDNVLLTPLLLRDEAVGMIVFANKPGGFERVDIEIVQAFGELLSISLANTRAYEALQSSEERFRQFFQNEPNYCLIISAEGMIIDINSAGLDALSCEKSELIGQPWYSIYDAESQAWLKTRRDDYHRPFVFSNQPLSIISRRGIRRNVLVSMNEIVGQRDRLPHYITVQNDVTRQVRIEAEQKQLIDIYQEQSEILTESNAQLETALNKVQESELKLHELYRQEKKLHNELESEIRKRADFTRTLVHELKTPLVPLVASASLLSEGLKDEPWQSIAANIERGSVNLSQRIDELLDVAKGEVGTLEVNLKTIHILPVIDEVVRQTRDLIEVRKQSLETDIEDPLPPVNADPGRICQVITNILNNASKYTPTGGTITLKAWSDSGLLKIAVGDTGLGIPAEDQQQIFNSYFRASNSRTQFQGMGIGLYLCKKIMELHHGNISLYSQEGKGSTFTLTLPVTNASCPVRIHKDGSSRRIALALENEEARKLASNWRDLWPGSEPVVAVPGQTVPDLCDDTTIDGLVLDIETVNDTCLDILRDLKSRRNIPAIILTSPDLNDCLVEEATRYSQGIFIKPFDHKKLIEHVKSIYYSRND